MAEKITFTAVQLRKFSRDSSGGKAEFSSSLTASIIKKMDWVEMPECLTGGKLEGELNAISLDLEPKDEALRRHKIQLDISAVNKFNTVRLELEDSRGKGHRTELRFKVKFTDVKGAGKLEAYMLTCGKSTLVVSYEKQAQQADLPGVELKDDGQEPLSGIQ